MGNPYELMGNLLESDGNGLARKGTTFNACINVADKVLWWKAGLQFKLLSVLDLGQELL